MADHPVKVPAELVKEWINDGPPLDQPKHVAHFIADRAAQWGADQELEACCILLDDGEHAASYGCHNGTSLRAARRPKPPTLAEQGCNALDAYIYGNPDHGDKQNTYNTIRAALNRLAELEAQQ